MLLELGERFGRYGERVTTAVALTLPVVCVLALAPVAELLGAVVGMNRELRVDAGVEDAPGMLNRALKKVSALARHDCLVCIISDVTGIDGDYIDRSRLLIDEKLFEPLDLAQPFDLAAQSQGPSRSLEIAGEPWRDLEA